MSDEAIGYVYECIYVCICICMYMYVRVCMCVYVYYIYIYIYACIYVSMSVSMSVCLSVCLSFCLYVCMYIHASRNYLLLAYVLNRKSVITGNYAKFATHLKSPPKYKYF